MKKLIRVTGGVVDRNAAFAAVLFFGLFATFVSGEEGDTAPPLQVDAMFPGGNIIVDSVDGDTVHVHQDLSDFGSGNWFYWAFRVRGAAGRNLSFQFTHPWGEQRKELNVIGPLGAAVSLDGGRRWAWLGTGSVNGEAFSYQFGPDENDVRLSFGMPYTEANFMSFIAPLMDSGSVDLASLAMTRGGRTVERLHIGKTHGEPEFRVLITARHHASEMMASYVLEGMVGFLLKNDTEGAWFRQNVEALVIPFMDKDGVEKGEQGKGRRGRDHNRDYEGESLYASTRALRRYVPVWSGGKLVAGLDLHCPWIRGGSHETIHQVGSSDPTVRVQQEVFGSRLEDVTRQSTLNYHMESDIEFGAGWNTADRRGTFKQWVSSLEGVRLATTVEVPYALASGQEVNQDTARQFGEDLGKALVLYLQGINPP